MRINSTRKRASPVSTRYIEKIAPTCGRRHANLSRTRRAIKKLSKRDSFRPRPGFIFNAAISSGVVSRSRT